MRKLILMLGLVPPVAFAHLHALEARPSYQIFVLKPGEKTNAELTLVSTEDRDQKITPEIKDWFVAPANKGIKTKDWLKTNHSPFDLKQGASRQIKFSVQAPKKAQGEVMGMLSFVSKSDQMAMVSFRLSLAVYVVIEGTEKKDGEVVAVSVYPSSDTVVSYLFMNKGNVHLRPRGLIQVYDDKDQLILNVVCTPALPTHPGQRQAYSGTVKNYRLPPGEYMAQVDLEDADWNMKYPTQKKKFTLLPNGKVKAR